MGTTAAAKRPPCARSLRSHGSEAVRRERADVEGRAAPEREVGHQLTHQRAEQDAVAEEAAGMEEPGQRAGTDERAGRPACRAAGRPTRPPTRRVGQGRRDLQRHAQDVAQAARGDGLVEAGALRGAAGQQAAVGWGTRYPRGDATTWRSSGGATSKAMICPRTGSTGGGQGSPPSTPAHAPMALITTAPAASRGRRARRPRARPRPRGRSPAARRGSPHRGRRPTPPGPGPGGRCRCGGRPPGRDARRTAAVRFGSASRISSALRDSTGRPRALCQSRRRAQGALVLLRERDLERAPLREPQGRCPSRAPALARAPGAGHGRAARRRQQGRLGMRLGLGREHAGRRRGGLGARPRRSPPPGPGPPRPARAAGGRQAHDAGTHDDHVGRDHAGSSRSRASHPTLGASLAGRGSALLSFVRSMTSRRRAARGARMTNGVAEGPLRALPRRTSRFPTPTRTATTSSAGPAAPSTRSAAATSCGWCSRTSRRCARRCASNERMVERLEDEIRGARRSLGNRGQRPRHRGRSTRSSRSA